MMNQWQALVAEIIKCRKSRITWLTFVAFSLAPIMITLFMMILKNPEIAANAGMLQSKASAVAFTADWLGYVNLLTQSIGVGGILIFGFVISWIFGREYSDGTAKDLLALPVTRANIVNAKFAWYMCWCIALVAWIIALGFVSGTVLGLPGWEISLLQPALQKLFITAALTIAINTPVAFLASYGKGYLAPLGFVALTLVTAQIVAAAGLGAWFPWSIPGLYSGSGGEAAAQLGAISFGILGNVCVLGYAVTILWWQNADHTK